ncbi:MAG: hypothetical protein AAF646_02920 [Pseudomonadota bacterium]
MTNERASLILRKLRKRLSRQREEYLRDKGGMRPAEFAAAMADNQESVEALEVALKRLGLQGAS